MGFAQIEKQTEPPSMSKTTKRAAKDPVSTKIPFDVSFLAISHPLRRQILEWLKDPLLYFPDQEYGHDLGVCAGQLPNDAACLNRPCQTTWQC